MGQPHTSSTTRLLKMSSTPPHDDGDATVCPICFNALPPLDKTELDTCQHVFCTRCISQWLCTPHNTCPMCRCVVSPQQYCRLIRAHRGALPDSSAVARLLDIVQMLCSEFSNSSRDLIIFQAIRETPASLEHLVTVLTEITDMFCNEDYDQFNDI